MLVSKINNNFGISNLKGETLCLHAMEDAISAVSDKGAIEESEWQSAPEHNT